MKSEKLKQILARFDKYSSKSNEELSESIYYAHCALPVYDSSEKELSVKRSYSKSFYEIKSESWEIKLAENIGSIFRCVISIEQLDRKGHVSFCFIGVEDDSEIASHIFNRVHEEIVWRTMSTFQRSIGRVFRKKITKSDMKNSVDNEVIYAKNTDVRDLVEDISSFAEALKSNEFGFLISKYFISQAKA